MMIVLTWIAHCVLIASVLTAGAYAWEVGARWSGGSARWGWLAALAGSVSLPWLVRLIPAAAAESLPVGIPVIALDAVRLDAGAGAGLSVPEAGVLMWVATSALVLGYVGYALVKLMQQRSGWREAELDGGRVLVTNGVGPAAVGVRAAMVVVPTWALHMDGELRSLLLRHEREHVRAGDPRLLLGGLVLLAAMPWNPFVWLQVMRLRNAIELDCDARVLSGGADPERYGSLLLEVGRRRGAHALVMATFAEPRAFLEERIRRIARWPLDRRPARAVAFALVGLVLFATALSARDPLRAGSVLPVASYDDIPVVNVVMPSDTPPEPTFTPMTTRPELVNRGETLQALLAAYPPLLRDAGIGGSAVIWFYIDAEGRVAHTRMSRTSGYPAIDEAALSVARQMRFSPATHEERTVGVWVEIPIVFSPDGASGSRVRQPAGERTPLPQPAAGEEKIRVPAPLGDLRDIARAPTFTPMTHRPELQNRDAVARLLVRSYPPLLRDAGIGGSPVIWFFIDEAGMVRKTQISKSSGHPALDEAALNVAAEMRFTPARNREENVAVWVEIPIVFTAK